MIDDINIPYMNRGEFRTINGNPRTMDDIQVGDIYEIMKPWSIRMNDGMMLIIVTEKFPTYAKCENIIYPSIYGMSKRFNICCNPIEIKEINRMKSYEEVRKWICKLPTYQDCEEMRKEFVRIKESFERRILHA